MKSPKFQLVKCNIPKFDQLRLKQNETFRIPDEIVEVSDSSKGNISNSGVFAHYIRARKEKKLNSSKIS